ncbi:MAG: hypothetical protein QNK37_02705 [Acidobacteriota bacterium]|nr:hypothetical protein [Acidobacteriota bacterium]
MSADEEKNNVWSKNSKSPLGSVSSVSSVAETLLFQVRAKPGHPGFKKIAYTWPGLIYAERAWGLIVLFYSVLGHESAWNLLHNLYALMPYHLPSLTQKMDCREGCPELLKNGLGGANEHHCT